MAEQSRAYVYDCCGGTKTTPLWNLLVTYEKEMYWKINPMNFNFLKNTLCQLLSSTNNAANQAARPTSHCLEMSYYVNFFEGLDGNEFHKKLRFGTHGS